MEIDRYDYISIIFTRKEVDKAEKKIKSLIDKGYEIDWNNSFDFIWDEYREDDFNKTILTRLK